LEFWDKFKEIFRRPVAPAPTIKEAWLTMREKPGMEFLKGVSYSVFYKKIRSELVVDKGRGDWALTKRNCDFLIRYRWAYINRLTKYLETDRKLIFIDESSLNSDLTSSKIWRLVGEKLHSSYGKRSMKSTSIISAISPDGLVGALVVEKTVNNI
jgi:hypothetical protein